MKKIMHRKLKLTIPTFNWDFEIVLTKNIIPYAKSVGYEENKDDGTTTALHMYYSDEMKSIIILNPNPKAGTVAHECWHAVRRMLLHTGCELDNEVVAYHLGYLVQQVHDFVKKRS